MKTTDETAAPPVAKATAPARARPAGATRTRVPPRAVWWVLGALVLAEAVHEVTGVGQAVAPLFDDWIHDGVILAAAVLCLVRGRAGDDEGPAWTWIGAGLLSWGLGETLWSLAYDNQASPPYPGVSDLFWLAWYPITVVGGALLIRGHLPRFELHRWMDGLAAVLIVLTAGTAIALQPVIESTHDSTAAAIVDFSYPVLDTILVGAVLGVYGLLGWRPGRTWRLLGAGILLMAVADAIFSVQQARGALLDERYDFLWPVACLLIARAAWSSAPPGTAHDEVYGWRAIALPLASQLLAAGIQVYGLFHELGSSERIVTLAVLLIASLQIVVSRPRRPGEPYSSAIAASGPSSARAVSATARATAPGTSRSSTEGRM